MDCDAVLAANCARLQQTDPTLVESIRTLPLTNLRLALNSSGLLIGQALDLSTQQWVALCDPTDPTGEAERDATALYSPAAKVFCLFGLGLGYFACALARRLQPYQRLAIFETRPELYAAACRTLDMGVLLGERRVHTYLGDALDAQLQHFWLSLESHEKFHIAGPLRSGFTGFIDAPRYEALLARTADMYRYHAVGLATWRQFGTLIGDNDLANLPEYCVTPGLDALQGLWQDKPAVCLAAGPSLVKNLALLTDPAVRQKVAVLCVGTIYALVRDLGIEPDIVTTIDFQPLNWGDQFRGLPLDPQTALVYLHSTWPTTPRRWPGPKFVALNASDTTAWMAQYTTPIKPHAAQVQTVAHLNLVTAYALGANPILLMGQDLAMPADAHHTPGAGVQDMSPAEAPDSHVPAEDFQGQPCWTRHSFLSMRTVFQQLVAAHGGCQVLNCTEGGLALEGIPNRPLADVLAEAPRQPTRLGPALRQAWQTFTPQVRWDDLTRDLHALAQQLTRLHTTASAVLILADQWEAAPDDATRDALFAQLVTHDRVIGESPLAFGQICVRRFDVVELLSAIPPAPETPALEIQRQNLTRWRTVARAVQAEYPWLCHLVQHTLTRLTDVLPDTPRAPDLRRVLVRESFDALRRWLPEVPLDADGLRLRAEVLFAQHRYADALALLEATHLAPALHQRCRARLEAATARVAPLRAVYYRCGETTTTVTDKESCHGNDLADQCHPHGGI